MRLPPPPPPQPTHPSPSSAPYRRPPRHRLPPRRPPSSAGSELTAAPLHREAPNGQCRPIGRPCCCARSSIAHGVGGRSSARGQLPRAPRGDAPSGPAPPPVSVEPPRAARRALRRRRSRARVLPREGA
eukprot:scaffold16987_cov60-Phaeocystis_antarctica.AAC.3